MEEHHNQETCPACVSYKRPSNGSPLTPWGVSCAHADYARPIARESRYSTDTAPSLTDLSSMQNRPTCSSRLVIDRSKSHKAPDWMECHFVPGHVGDHADSHGNTWADSEKYVTVFAHRDYIRASSTRQLGRDLRRAAIREEQENVGGGPDVVVAGEALINSPQQPQQPQQPQAGSQLLAQASALRDCRTTCDALRAEVNRLTNAYRDADCARAEAEFLHRAAMKHVREQEEDSSVATARLRVDLERSVAAHQDMTRNYHVATRTVKEQAQSMSKLTLELEQAQLDITQVREAWHRASYTMLEVWLRLDSGLEPILQTTEQQPGSPGEHAP